mgnify:FL=1
MIIDDNFLSSDSKEFIESYILTRHFPLYMQGESVVDDETPFLNHVVLARPEMKDFTDKHEYHDTFVKILDEFCNNNDISYNEVLRICVNFTFYNGIRDESPTHVDHDFEHNQLIVYLNEPLDSKSSTVILDENKTKIAPKKYRGLSFGKIEHYHYYPKIGGRYVLVFTFK